MSFVWLPVTALESGSQADHQLYWKPKQQVGPWFLLIYSFFYTNTLPVLQCERSVAEESLSCRVASIFAWHCNVWLLCLLDSTPAVLDVRDAWTWLRITPCFSLQFKITWASNKGWSWPILCYVPKNPHAWTQTFTQAIVEQLLFSSNYNYIYILLQDLNRKW